MNSVLNVNMVSKTYEPSFSISRVFKKGAPSVRKSALSKVSLDVAEGEIFGLLGENGAGKSTLIKIIVGLIKPNEGSVKINGFDIEKERQKALSQIGGLIESPDFSLNLTGRQNLQYLATLQGNVGKERIDAIAKIMGISEVLDKKVNMYSFGMKQRLGIAQAIMHKPKLLLLDEPTNGLDPQAIVMLRELLKELAKTENMAIIISSHTLSEIQNLCSRVAILKHGEMLALSTLKDLQNNTSKNQPQIKITCNNPQKASAILKQKFDFNHTINELELFIDLDERFIPEINKDLVLNDIIVYGISSIKPNLESIFTELNEVKND